MYIYNFVSLSEGLRKGTVQSPGSKKKATVHDLVT